MVLSQLLFDVTLSMEGFIINEKTADARFRELQ